MDNVLIISSGILLILLAVTFWATMQDRKQSKQA